MSAEREEPRRRTAPWVVEKQVQEKDNKRPPPREARRPGRELLREAG